MLLLAALGCAVVCLAAGLATSPSGGDRRVAAMVAVVQLVGGAVLGWLIGWILSLTPAETAALALVGAAPGTVAASPFIALAGGNLTLAQGVMAISGFAALLAVTIVALLGGGGQVLVLLIVAAALPFWGGMLLRPSVSLSAQRIAPIIAGLVLAVMIVAGLLMGGAGAAFWPLLGGSVLLAVALTLLGNGLGRAPGMGPSAPQTLSVALSMRNIAVPMLAGFAAGLPAAPMAAAVYGIVMYLPALAVVIARVRRSRR